MPHLLIDLAKLKKTSKIPYKHAKVGLMVSLKQAKKLITPDEPHAVYVLPEKKAGNSIIQAALDILNAHPDSHVLIISPRKSIQAAVKNIAQQYPQAKLAHFKKNSKKVKTWLKNIAKQPEQPSLPLHQTNDNDLEARIIQNSMARSQQNAANQTVFTLLEQTNQAAEAHSNDAELNAALILFKKNRPKKKTDLVRLLSKNQRATPQNALQLVIKLQQQGHIHIDAAENVRYQ